MTKASSTSVEHMVSNLFLVFDANGVLVPIDKTQELLSSLMAENRQIQNCYVTAFLNDERISREVGKHLTAEQREWFTFVASLPSSYKSQLRYNRNNAEEVCRILKAWQVRDKIGQLIEDNPDITNKQIVDKLDKEYVNYRWIDNIRRAGGRPSKPFIKTVRLALGCDSNIIKKVCRDGFWLHRVHIKDETVDIFVPVSKKQYANFGKITKIGAPIIRPDGYGNFVFDFLVHSKRKAVKDQPNFIGVDPKLNNGFAAVLINGETKQISGYFQPSVQVQRCQRKIDHIGTDIGYKMKRLERLKACKNPNLEKIEALQDQIDSLRAKKQRVNDALDWQAACDLVGLSEQKNAVICYENVKCNLGGKLHFRSTKKREKVEQVAAKHSRQVVKVNAAHTSQDCPNCGHRERKALSNRTHYCKKCGLKCDRDYASAIVMAKRGGKIDDPRWTEAIMSKKQIHRSSSRVVESKRPRVGCELDKTSRTGCGHNGRTQRLILHRDNSASKKPVIVEYDRFYLVGTMFYELVSTKRTTSGVRQRTLGVCNMGEISHNPAILWQECEK